MARNNPAINDAIYDRAALAGADAVPMTLGGAIRKSALLVVILLLTGGYTWSLAASGVRITPILLIGGSLGGLVVAMVTIFSPRSAPVTAPIYAALEGLVLGALSALFEARYPGIVINAVGLSVGVLALMLFAYTTRIIRVTQRFMIAVLAATGAVCLVYLVSIVMVAFGARIPLIHQSGPIGIAFSAAVVIIAAVNLLVDFDFIERGVQLGAPQYMEWYAGFSLLVTLVWMYLEILRLLSKLRSR